MMEIVLEEAKKTSVFHLTQGLYFFSMQRTSVCAVHGSSSKVSASKDYILLCILVFDRAAPLCGPQCIVPHYIALLSSLTRLRVKDLIQNKVSQSKMFWQLTPGSRKITTLIRTIIIPPLAHLD